MEVKTKVFSHLCNGFVSCFQSLEVEFSFTSLLMLWFPSHGYLFTLSLVGMLWSSSLSHPLIVQDIPTCKYYLLWKIVDLEKGTSKFIFSTFKFKRWKRRDKNERYHTFRHCFCHCLSLGCKIVDNCDMSDWLFILSFIHFLYK